MYTIKDIARIVGVSTATVSNALNGRENVSEEMRAKIFAAAETLNYIPNISAKLMKLRDTHNIGLFLPYLGGAFYTTLIKEIFDQCVEAGYSLLIHVSHDIDSQVLLANILSCNIDAAIVLSDRFADEHIPLLETRGVPVVFLDRRFSGKQFSSVVIHNEMGIRQAVAYLARTGHGAIAHLHGILENYDGYTRKQAFVDSMREEGLPVHPEWMLDGHFSAYAAYSATRAMLTRPDTHKPNAVVCADDDTAMGCIRAYQDLGYVVPRDVSVTGLSSQQGTSSMEIAVTSARYSLHAWAATAVATLLNMLQRKAEGTICTIDTQLIVGSTTQPRRPE